MREAVARMVLVALAVVATYGLLLVLIEQSPLVDVRNPLAVGWTGIFLLGLAFAAWNAGDSVLDIWGAIRKHRPRRILAGGQWLARSNGLQGVTCLMLAAVGWSVILMWGTAEQRAWLLMAGGAALVVNQIWNRLDRERVQRLPGAASEARLMEQLAVALAADARRMGHDVAETLQYPVGVLEMLRLRPGLTEQEVAEIDRAVTQLVALAEHIRDLHQQVRAHDPSVRDQEDA